MNKTLAGLFLAFLALAMLLLCYGEVFSPLLKSSFGISAIPAGNEAKVTAVVRQGSAYKNGLRPGDMVELGRLSYVQRIRFQMDVNPAGTVLALPVKRDGVARVVTVVSGPFSGPHSMTFNTAGFLFQATVTLLVMALIVVRRPSLATAALVLYGMGSCTTLLVVAQFSWLPDSLYQFAAVFIFTAFSSLPVMALLPFVVRFPRQPSNERARLRMHLADAVFVVSVFVFTYQTLAEPMLFASWTAFDLWSAVAGMLVVLAFTAFVFVDSSGEDRRRVAWVFAGMVISTIAYTSFNFLDVLELNAGSAPAVLHMGLTASELLQTALPICLAYAVLRHRVLDIGFALNRTMVYGVTTVLVIALIGAVDWATSAYLHEFRLAMALDAAATIAIAFALNRVHRWVENAVDVLFYRKKYEAESYLARLARTFYKSSAETTIDRELVGAPHTRFNLSMAALFRENGEAFVISSSAADSAAPPAFERDHELVRFLCTERKRIDLHHLVPHRQGGASIAIPLLQGDDLTGFALYGTHRDGTHLDPDEIEALERLCESAAQAYTYLAYVRYRAARSTATV